MTTSKEDEPSPRLRTPISRNALCLLPTLLLPLLVGCHADVTVRFDVRGDGMAFVTTKEIIDDELYNLALSQDGSGDPFYTERMQRGGWLILRSIDSNRNHVFTMSKLIDRNEYTDLNRRAPILGHMRKPVGTIQFSRAPGLLFERDSISATIAPLLPLASSTFSAYSGVASEMLSSALAVHLEIKTPGKVLATNGAILPDGAVRWDLNLEEPTIIEYRARIISIYTVGLVILVALTLGFAVSVAWGRLDARTRSRFARVSIRKS